MQQDRRQEQNDRILSLENKHEETVRIVSEFRAAVGQQFEVVNRNLQDLSNKIDTRGKPNSTYIVVFVTIMLAVPGGLIWLMSSQIDRLTSPLALRIEGLNQTAASLDRRLNDSMSAISQLQRDTSNLQNQVSSGMSTLHSHDQQIIELTDRTARSTAADGESRADRGQMNTRIQHLESALSEVEAHDANTNANFAEIETQFKGVTQWIAVMWEKSMGSRFPSDVRREAPTIR